MDALLAAEFVRSFSISHLIGHHPIETRQCVDGAGDKQSTIHRQRRITADEHTNKGAKAWHTISTLLIPPGPGTFRAPMQSFNINPPYFFSLPSFLATTTRVRPAGDNHIGILSVTQYV